MSGGRRDADPVPLKREGHRWGFYAAVMGVCLLLSMAGNGLHVWSQWHTDVAAGVDRGDTSPWVPTAAIMVFPGMVMVMTEMVVISYRRNAGGVRTVITVMAGLVGLITLAVSYLGLVYVCGTILGIPGWLGYLAPLAIDAPIIAATIGLWDVVNTIRVDHVAGARPVADHVVDHVATGGRPTTWPVVADRVAAPVVEGPVAGGEPTAVTVADHMADPVADHMADIEKPQFRALSADWPVVAASAPATPAATVAASSAAEDATDGRPADHVADLVAAVRPVVGEVADRVAGGRSAVADQPAGRPAMAARVADDPEVADHVAGGRPVADPVAAGEVAAPSAVAGDRLIEVAERVHARANTAKPIEDVLAVVRLLDRQPEMSRRAIAGETGVGRSTVDKWAGVFDEVRRTELEPVGGASVGAE
ncbi:MAG: hypothetical protein QM809_18365 [Gordonia sp. (in: high G+C Gram-positive bacteria)]|uniref:hypothetical protein n=1 Tax=Gordonia sp. (in: high G+C Gram-positive bacteria) TaxID=84139 RepID=UPI0039E28784